MTTKQITATNVDNQIKQLYESAFPVEEQIPREDFDWPEKDDYQVIPDTGRIPANPTIAPNPAPSFKITPQSLDTYTTDDLPF